MSTPGIGDPYWYEWYVGLENIIDMLNEDNGIEYVIFQKDLYDTIDDVVVGYKSHLEYCYQVKHEIGSNKKYNLTFDKLIKREKRGGYEKLSLIQSLAKGWKDASEESDISIVPVLYTNRTLGVNKTTRNYKGYNYMAMTLGEFISKVQEKIDGINNLKEIHFDDENLKSQYQEFCESITLDDCELIEFLRAIKIKSQMSSLDEFEELMCRKLQKYFNCNSELANILFRNLTSQLRIWTTTRRNEEKINIEDVYDALALKQEYESTSQHQLVAPSPFFESRKKFIDEISQNIYESDKKVVFLSGEPGCGKTSIISYMQNNYDCFVARYHIFRPISPEQRFYNFDEGLCSQESLWGELMNQLRRRLKGQLLKYNVPVNNALCEIGDLRREVLRILEEIYKSNGKKVYVCVDGIDHAARSKLSVTLLYSLFQPDEIPEGICFIIVGQPEETYQNYPVWLNKDNKEILYIRVPRLCIDDIKQLLFAKITLPEFQNDGLARGIFEKTQGNNLSVVFAIEEIRKSESVETALKFLDLSHISGDVEQYYTHIWNYLKDKIKEFGLCINFPDITVASAILLLNGKIKVDLLAKALKDINLNREEWSCVFDCLYPVIGKSEKDNTYFVFHNDFRVFLMGVVKKNEAKYKELSYKMASYFIDDSDEIPEKYVNIIPLLNCAGKSAIIPKVFTTEFVIGALANGVSRNRLDDYACQAYKYVCQNKNWNDFHKVYLAISTIKQHYAYFEYYDMQYEVQDISSMQQIQSFEIINKKFSDDTLDEFNEVLEFINCLIKDGGDKHYNRISTTYDLWFGQLTPFQAIQELISEVESLNIIWRTNEITNFMKKWGKVAAFLGKYQYLVEDITDSEGDNDLLEFNDAFFDYYFYEKNYKKAIEVAKKANITYKCVENKIFYMMEENTVISYIELIQMIADSKRNSILNKLAKILCMINGANKYNIEDVCSCEDVTHILDDSTFEIVVNSILDGIRNHKNDIDVVCGSVFRKLKIERNDYNEQDINYLKSMIRVCIVIGRHILDKTLLNENEKRIIEDFMKRQIRRTFDFSKAYKTIVYCLCNLDIIDESFNNDKFSNLVRDALFQYANIGQYCKTIFLDYLLRKNHLEISKEYFLKLYGEDGSALYLHDQYKDLFYHYYDYAKDVIPELCGEIERNLKWNVVGYTGHKEYALNGPEIVLEELLKNTPQLWKEEGVKLYNLSNIADISSGNRISGKIEDTVSKAAIRSGIHDYWQWHHYDKEIAYQLHTLYSQIFYMINQVTNNSQLLDIWLYSCGIQSWYHQDDRIGIKNVYYECKQKAEKIGYTSFENDCREYTPSYLDISLYEELNSKYTPSQDEFSYNWKIECEKAIDEIDKLPLKDLVYRIIYQGDENHSWKKINRAIERLCDEGSLSVENANSILKAVISKLKQYEWEHCGCSGVLEKLMSFLGESASWELATSIVPYLNEYHYATSTSNMFFILSKNFDKFNLQEMFDEEYDSEYKWVSGNGHIILKSEGCKVEEFNTVPDNITEALFMILLENLSLGNIHRMEIALPAIYNMCKKSKELFLTIVKVWKDLSENAKKSIMMCSVRWAREQAEGFKYLVTLLEDEYAQSNILSIKYVLHTVLLIYYQSLDENNKFDITFEAKPAEDAGYRNLLLSLHKDEVDSNTKFFLELMKNYDDVEDLYKLMPLFNEVSDCKYSVFNRYGDSVCISNVKHDISQQILYREEYKGRWNYVPLHVKKQWLVSIDDSYLMTSTPNFSYSDCWNIESSLAKFKVDYKYLEIEKLLQIISEDGINKDEIVIGAVVCYPIDRNDGIIYTRVGKVLSKKQLFVDNKIYPAFMNYSIICDEDNYFEVGYESENEGGICLVRKCVGSSMWYYNNPMICPSNIIIKELKLILDSENPYVWCDNNHTVVLRYERISNPTRNITQQYYIRQPIMGRWICNKQFLNDWLGKKMLYVKYTTDLSNY